ncbi:hypothetical protein JCM3765_003013 [Sporobolomyces pararoseus]
MVSCQKCRQPISPASFPNYDPTSRTHPTPHHHLEDSLASLSPSTYDFLSHSERYQHPHPQSVPPSIRPYYNTAINRSTSSTVPRSTTAAIQRVVVPSPSSTPLTPRLPPHLGPAESFVVLTDSAFHPSSSSSSSVPPLSTPPSSSQPFHPSDSSSPLPPSPQATSLNSRLTQLSHLSSLLSSTSSIDHPLCLECADQLVSLMQSELEFGKKERDKLFGFEKEVFKKREDSIGNNELTREGLERDINKLKKAEQHAINELKTVESKKEVLEQELKVLELEETELSAQEAQFWIQHSKYVIERDVLQSRQNSLITRLSNSQKDLDKLQRTNVYNDTFCIGQESTLGTINSLRLGRLPSISPPVEWSEINAALGHTLLLLETISKKFGMRDGFVGWKLKCCGSFSRIVKLEEGGKEGESYELYGSSDLSISRVLQNRRFDFAMVAFLDCLRQLIEWVGERDRSVRIPHRIVKDKIGDVSIKYQFGSDETWSRALRHVLLDLKILLGRASI